MSAKRIKREKTKHCKCLASTLSSNNVQGKLQPAVSSLLKEVRELVKRLNCVV